MWDPFEGRKVHILVIAACLCTFLYLLSTGKVSIYRAHGEEVQLEPLKPAAIHNLAQFKSNISPTRCLSSQSQSNEENTLRDELGFEKTSAGVYVEIGALDGKRFSNTASLATCQKWQGVLVEANWNNYQSLKRNVVLQKRPMLTAYFGAVCNSTQESVTFLMNPNVPAVGGDVSLMAESFKSSWHPDKDHSEVAVVPCKPMDFYLRNVTHVNFFSLDVEGAELMVLETINFSRVHIEVFLIEFDETQPLKNAKIISLLTSLKYSECLKFTVERSKVFVHKKSNYHANC